MPPKKIQARKQANPSKKKQPDEEEKTIEDIISEPQASGRKRGATGGKKRNSSNLSLTRSQMKASQQSSSMETDKKRYNLKKSNQTQEKPTDRSGKSADEDDAAHSDEHQQSEDDQPTTARRSKMPTRSRTRAVNPSSEQQKSAQPAKKKGTSRRDKDKPPQEESKKPTADDIIVEPEEEAQSPTRGRAPKISVTAGNVGRANKQKSKSAARQKKNESPQMEESKIGGESVNASAKSGKKLSNKNASVKVRRVSTDSKHQEELPQQDMTEPLLRPHSEIDPLQPSIAVAEILNRQSSQDHTSDPQRQSLHQPDPILSQHSHHEAATLTQQNPDTASRLSHAEESATTAKKPPRTRKTSLKTTSKKPQHFDQSDQPQPDPMELEPVNQQSPQVNEPSNINLESTIMNADTVHMEDDNNVPANRMSQQSHRSSKAEETKAAKASKTINSRKSESIPLPQQLSASELPQKLTEEEVKIKYQDNEDYQEWSRKITRFKNEFERAQKKGLPKLYPYEEDMQQITSDFTRNTAIANDLTEKFQEFKILNVEPSGEMAQDYDFEAFFEDQEVKRALTRMIAFQIEGSNQTLNELINHCLSYLVSECIPEFSNVLQDYHVEQLITGFAIRKPYGIKQKNANVYKDKSPLTLWCWEISEIDLLEPVPKNQVSKARTQRSIVGKKLVTLQTIIDTCLDYTTFDSLEKVAKLSLEYENYNKLIQKENSSEWMQRKRKHNEVEQTSEQSKTQSANASKVVNKPPAAAGKKLKQNTEEQSEMIGEISEAPIFQEQSQTPLINPQIRKSAIGGKQQQDQQANQQPLGNQFLTSFFKKIDKPLVQDNPSQLLLKSKEELQTNPFIHFSGKCETEAMKLRRALIPTIEQEWPCLDTQSILDKFKALKTQDLKQISEQKPSTAMQRVSSVFSPPIQQQQRRLKHIQIHDSGMHYNGIQYDKQSRIINCKKPFEMDPTIIDYDQGSDEEWEEIHGENLEDDDELIDEENMEVQEDEYEREPDSNLSFPDAGVSNAIKQKLAFRSQYCFNTLQYKEDDPELKREGFIVADDYFSQDSSFDGQGSDSNQKYDYSRKELLKKQMEQQERRVRQGLLRPYILLSAEKDLGDYKAVSLKKKAKIPPSSLRISFGEASTADEGGIEQFPLSVLKAQKKEMTKLDIKDVIEQLIEIGHGTSLSKKQLTEQVRRDFGDLKKTHIEMFIKECFEKQKRPFDSKMRLYAKTDAVDKYGGSEVLVQNMPLILEKKLEEEKVAAAVLAQEQPPNSTTPSKQGKDLSSIGDTNATQAKQAGKVRQSKAVSSRQSSVSMSQIPKPDTVEHSRVSHSQGGVIHEEQEQHDQIPDSKNEQALSLEAQKSLGANQSSCFAEPQSELQMATSQPTVQNQQQDVEMAEEYLMASADNEENSWMNVTGGVVNAETPAFNSKVYDPTDQELHDDSQNMTGVQHFNSNNTQQHLHHSQSQSFLLGVDNEISLSQHAVVVSSNNNDDQQHVEINNNSFQRSNQQYQSTPIQNFRSLRSREISVNNSQNDQMIEMDDVAFGSGIGRERSDSVETDKGAPPHQTMTNLDQHLLTEQHQDLDVTFYHQQQNSFETPPGHLSSSKLNPPALAGNPVFQMHPDLHHEESKQLIQQPLHQVATLVSIHFDDNEEESKVIQPSKSPREGIRSMSRKKSISVQGYDQQQPAPRRSKRLESRHKLLQQSISKMSKRSGFEEDDELIRAYSQNDIEEYQQEERKDQ